MNTGSEVLVMHENGRLSAGNALLWVMKCWYSMNTGDEVMVRPGTAGTAGKAGMHTGYEVVLHEYG